MNQKLTPKEINWRIGRAKAHLAQIGNSQTFRKEIELTEQLAQKEGIEAYWKLQDKLSRELANHLINYQGSSEATAFVLKLADILNGIETPEEKWYRIRENIKEFLNSDEDIANHEPFKSLSEAAIDENTMDGYYNLLKNFRKKHTELIQLKKTEENADDFLARLTNVIYDQKN